MSCVKCVCVLTRACVFQCWTRTCRESRGAACGRGPSTPAPSLFTVTALRPADTVWPILQERWFFFISYLFKFTRFAEFCKFFVFSLCIFYSLEPCKIWIFFKYCILTTSLTQYFWQKAFTCHVWRWSPISLWGPWSCDPFPYWRWPSASKSCLLVNNEGLRVPAQKVFDNCIYD